MDTDMDASTSEAQPRPEPQGWYEWNIPDWSQQPAVSIRSENFEIGTHTWRARAFPQGNKVPALSVYLDYPLAPYMTEASGPRTDFKIVLVNHLDPARNFSKSTHHTFTDLDPDWGFTTLLELAQVNDPTKGFIAADGSLTLRLEITVLQGAEQHAEGWVPDAHLYCNVVLSTDQDLQDQIGKTHHFDLVDRRKLPAAAVLRLKTDTPFAAVKALVAERLGVPEEEQRFWVRANRQNGTTSPSRVLSELEESRPLVGLREFRDARSLPPQDVLVDIPLFLERVCPTFSYHHSAVYENGCGELTLFVKLYNPQTEELTYIGRAHFRKATQVSQMLVPLLRLAQLDPALQAHAEVYEEVQSEPSVMCLLLTPGDTLAEVQLEDGDILCLQCRPTPEQHAQLRHPTIPQFLAYMHARRSVEVRTLSEPGDIGTTLEMSTEMGYDEVTKAIAQHMGGVQAVDAACLRLTQHDTLSQGPRTAPIKWGQAPKLGAMLQPGGDAKDHILYDEVLATPLLHVEPYPDLCCPITHMLLEDPVSTADGHVYSRAAIEQWLTTSRISPSTGLQLPSVVLLPCFAMRGVVDRWLAEHGL